MEVWKDILGYEGLYQISNFGRVKSLDRLVKSKLSSLQKRLGIPIKSRLKKNGYVQVKLSRLGVFKHFTVHRLVAIHFLPNANNLSEVNHIDGDKKNNFVSNLEWVTSSENQKHAFAFGLQKIKKGLDNPCSKRINQLSIDGTVIKVHNSIKEIKRNLGFNSVGIIGCCKQRKKYKTAYGFKWKYHNE